MTYPNTSNANGIWTLRDTFLARKGNIWPSVLALNLDPFFDYVSLLLSMDGDDASTTFTDSSHNGLTVTANGNAAISTSESKFWRSAAFDGNGDWLEIADDPAFDLFGDFTVECWFYLTSSSGSFPRLWAFGTYNAANSMTLSVVNDGTANNGKISLDFNGSQYQSVAGLVAFDTWQHIAVARIGSSVKVYLDGIERLSVTSSAAVQRSQPFIIGNLHGFTGTTTAAFGGYIDDLRITKGFCRYTADFTPPTLPFGTAAPVQLDPYFENYVSLLLHMDGANGSTTFTDSSNNGLSFTASGNAQISTTQSKFGGASAYFDGTGDYITSSTTTSALTLGTGDFTIEFWLYPTSTPAGGVLQQTPTSVPAIYINIDSTFGVRIGRHGINQLDAASDTLSLNAWTHLAFVRNSGVVKIFFNGVSQTLTSNNGGIGSYDFSATKAIEIGRTADTSLNGYIDDLRITRGIARYTTNFTPPTKAFPDTLLTNDLYFDNVSLLLPMDGTNGSTTFTDESDNGLTVTANGNAAISTSESKFGGASAYFDGTGDFLIIAHDAAIVFGSDSFTLECWVRPTSSAGGTIYSKRANTSAYAGLNLYAGVSNLYPALYVELGGGNFGWEIGATSSVALTINEWNHVALVRNGSQWNLYINGVSGISATNSNSIYDDGSDAGIGDRYGASFPIEGYIDDFRITKGVARYTSSFNPPTRAFPNE